VRLETGYEINEDGAVPMSPRMDALLAGVERMFRQAGRSLTCENKT